MEKKSELAIKFGAEVRRVRQEQGWSQEGFADACGIHRTYIGNVERGEKVVSIDMAKRVVDKLGLSLARFFEQLGE